MRTLIGVKRDTHRRGSCKIFGWVFLFRSHLDWGGGGGEAGPRLRWNCRSSDWGRLIRQKRRGASIGLGSKWRERKRDPFYGSSGFLSFRRGARAHLHFHFESHFLRSASPSLSILFLLSVFWFLPNKSLVRNSNQSKTTSELIEKIMH